MKKSYLLFLIILLGQIHFAFCQNSVISNVWIVSSNFAHSSDAKEINDRVKTLASKLEKSYQIKKIDYLENYTQWKKITSNTAIPNNKEKLLIIFYGHSNSKANDLFFHFKGKDLSINEAKIDLKKIKSNLVILWCSEAGTKATRFLSSTKRVIIASTELEDLDNAPAALELLPEIIDNSHIDFNNNKQVDLVELQRAIKTELEQWYQSQNLVQLESVIIDGDGDGTGTMVPNDNDKTEAEKIVFQLK